MRSDLLEEFFDGIRLGAMAVSFIFLLIYVILTK